MYLKKTENSKNITKNTKSSIVGIKCFNVIKSSENCKQYINNDKLIWGNSLSGIGTK